MKHYLLVLWIAAALIGCAGYGYYWHYVAGRLQTGIEDWAVQQRALCHEIAFETDPISGFPFAFRTQFRAVALTWHLPSGAVSIAGDRLTAELRPWNLQAIHVISAQPLTASLADGASAPQQARLRDGVADIALHGGGQLKTIALTASGAEIDGPQGTYAADKVELAVELPTDMPADYHQPLLGFDVNLAALRLPPGQRALTAEAIETTAAAGSIMGPVPPATSLRDAIAGWAGAGGVLELKSFTFAQAPLRVAGEGTLTLDEALQPLGALAIRAQGLPDTIALLERDGVIDAQAAKTGKYQ